MRTPRRSGQRRAGGKVRHAGQRLPPPIGPPRPGGNPALPPSMKALTPNTQAKITRLPCDFVFQPQTLLLMAAKCKRIISASRKSKSPLFGAPRPGQHSGPGAFVPAPRIGVSLLLQNVLAAGSVLRAVLSLALLAHQADPNQPSPDAPAARIHRPRLSPVLGRCLGRLILWDLRSGALGSLSGHRRVGVVGTSMLGRRDRLSGYRGVSSWSLSWRVSVGKHDPAG